MSALGAEAPTATDATRVLPGALDRVWEAPTRVEDPRWASRTAARRRRLLNVSAAGLSVVLVVALGLFAGLRSAEEPEDARAAGSDGGAGAEAEQAGEPAAAPEDGRPVEEVLAGANAGRDLGALAVESNVQDRLYVLDDTTGAELLPAGTISWSGIQGPMDAEAQARVQELVILFEPHEGPGAPGEMAVPLTLEFLSDEGAYAVRNSDFSVLHIDPGAGVGHEFMKDDPDVTEYPVEGDDVLALLTPEQPEARIEVTAEGVPERGYLVYDPDPADVWGAEHAGLPTWSSYFCYSAAEGEWSDLRDNYEDNHCG